MLWGAADRLWFSAPGAVIRRSAHHTVGLLVPTWCVGCRADGTDLCPECFEDLRRLTCAPFRAEAGAEALPVTGFTGNSLDILPVVAAGHYQTLMADVVLAFKDHERVRLSRALAPALRRAVEEAVGTLLPTKDALLVWPPATPRSRMRRGRHPLTELMTAARLPEGLIPAGQLLRHRVLGYGGTGLRALSSRGTQKSRSKVRRRQSVPGFTLAPGAEEVLEGADVLLIDDVLTTGSTLHALYDLLTAAGAQVHGAAVLASTPRSEANFG